MSYKSGLKYIKIEALAKNNEYKDILVYAENYSMEVNDLIIKNEYQQHFIDISMPSNLEENINAIFSGVPMNFYKWYPTNESVLILSITDIFEIYITIPTKESTSILDTTYTQSFLDYKEEIYKSLDLFIMSIRNEEESVVKTFHKYNKNIFSRTFFKFKNLIWHKTFYNSLIITSFKSPKKEQHIHEFYDGFSFNTTYEVKELLDILGDHIKTKNLEH